MSNREKRQARVVGLRIRQERERNCLTLQGLCDAIHLASNLKVSVTPGAISRWENGQHSVAMRYRTALSEALSVPTDRLFERVFFIDDEAVA